MITTKSASYFRSILFIKRKVIICSLLLVGVCAFPFFADAFEIRLGAGEPGTFSHFTGRMLCRVIGSQMSEVNCEVIPTPGDVDNLTNLRGGSLDIGLVDSRMLIDAVNKSGQFEFLDISYENIRALAPLYDIPVTLLVRDDAGINALQDLTGKRINAGTPRSLQALTLGTIMEAKGWSKKDFSLVGELPPSQNQDTMAFCHGTMQAMVHIGVHPDPSLEQLFKLCNAKVVNMDDADIEKLITGNPAFWKAGITAGTYPSRPEEVATFGTRAILVASEDLDAETVYRIIDAIYSSQQRLAGAHSALSLFPAGVVQKEITGIQLHPGAFKYFSEK